MNAWKCEFSFSVVFAPLLRSGAQILSAAQHLAGIEWCSTLHYTATPKVLRVVTKSFLVTTSGDGYKWLEIVRNVPKFF